jgi:hypothetical protein
VGAVRRAQIGRDCIGPPARFADLIDHGLSLVGVAAVVNDDTGAGGGSVRAVARPMPREAPVTRAVLLARLAMTAFSMPAILPASVS